MLVIDTKPDVEAVIEMRGQLEPWADPRTPISGLGKRNARPQ
jgi:hypothetical protein